MLQRVVKVSTYEARIPTEFKLLRVRGEALFIENQAEVKR